MRFTMLVADLKGEPFQLYPDFPTGGAIDVSKYNDGQRGGALKVRAKIDQVRQQDTRYQRDTIRRAYRQPHRFYHQSG